MLVITFTVSSVCITLILSSSVIDTAFKESYPFFLLYVLSEPHTTNVPSQDQLEDGIQRNKEMRVCSSVIEHTLRQRSDSPVSNLEELI